MSIFLFTLLLPSTVLLPNCAHTPILRIEAITVSPMHLPYEAGPDDAPQYSTNESSPLLFPSMIYGRVQRVRYSTRPRYTSLHDIEEAASPETNTSSSRRFAWKKFMIKGLVCVLLLGILVLTVVIVLKDQRFRRGDCQLGLCF